MSETTAKSNAVEKAEDGPKLMVRVKRRANEDPMELLRKQMIIRFELSMMN